MFFNEKRNGVQAITERVNKNCDEDRDTERWTDPKGCANSQAVGEDVTDHRNRGPAAGLVAVLVLVAIIWFVRLVRRNPLLHNVKNKETKDQNQSNHRHVTNRLGVVRKYIGDQIEANQAKHQASRKTQEQVKAIFYLQR